MKRASFTGKSAGAMREFFRATCHPRLTRRQLLAGGGAMLATLSAGLVADPASAKSDNGTAVIKRWASVPEDPWVVAHGVRAMGWDFALKDGRRAVDYLLATAVMLPANDKTVLGFRLEVEAHPNGFLKTLLEAGAPLDYAFTHDGRRRTVSELVEGARARVRPQLLSSKPNELPWTLIALTRTTPPPRAKWTNAWREPVDLDGLVETSLRLLEQASAPVTAAMREGRPESGKAPVHNFTCGGTHMLYALLAAIHAGYTGTDRRARVQRQVDLMIWRLGADLDLIDRFYRARERASDPKAPWYELDTKLKLLGHGEECLAFAAVRKVAEFTPAQRAQRQAAAAKLDKLLVELGGRNLQEARGMNRELYRQLVGDACHARHGLTLT